MFAKLEVLKSWFTPSANDDSAEAYQCLVIDGDAVLRTALSSSLKACGLRVLELGDARDLARIIRSTRPNIVFLEVALRNGDAIDAIRALDSARYQGAVQILSSSDKSVVSDVNHIGIRRTLRMLEPLRKPVDLQAIRSVALAHCKGPRSQPLITLQDALTRGWIDFVYQPKINLAQKRLQGAELLARINHPEFGVFSPGAFLPSANPRDLQQLTNLALSTAVEDSRRLHKAGITIELSVNATANSLTAAPISSLLRGRLNTSGLPLLIEISHENSFDDPTIADEVSTQLRLYNAKLVLDNFGSAHSLLRCRSTKFAELKLSPALVRGCSSDKISAALCATAINLAHGLGTPAVAVGIENTEDLRTVSHLKCDLVQGHLFGKPATFSEFIKLVKAKSARANTGVTELHGHTREVTKEKLL